MEGRKTRKKKKRIGVAAEKREYSLFFSAVATLLSKEKKTPLQQSREKARTAHEGVFVKTHDPSFSSKQTNRRFCQDT